MTHPTDDEIIRMEKQTPSVEGAATVQSTYEAVERQSGETGELYQTAPSEETLHDSRCANCGTPPAPGKAIFADYPEEGEWFCSTKCKDQHDELGCPHEWHDGYRHPAEAERLIAAEGVLRSLASWLGAGGFNAPTVDAKVFEEKIRWGVDNAIKNAVPAAARALLAEQARTEPTQAELLQHLIEGVRAFRNEPMLGKLLRLRSTPGYVAMTTAWEDAVDTLDGAEQAKDAEEDAELLEWLEEKHYALHPIKEDQGDDTYTLWWQVTDKDKSISGHPLGNIRAAIRAARAAERKA